MGQGYNDSYKITQGLGESERERERDMVRERGIWDGAWCALNKGRMGQGYNNSYKITQGLGESEREREGRRYIFIGEERIIYLVSVIELCAYVNTHNFFYFF
jgi:hypothetical protein